MFLRLDTPSTHTHIHIDEPGCPFSLLLLPISELLTNVSQKKKKKKRRFLTAFFFFSKGEIRHFQIITDGHLMLLAHEVGRNYEVVAGEIELLEQEKKKKIRVHVGKRWSEEERYLHRLSLRGK